MLDILHFLQSKVQTPFKLYKLVRLPLKLAWVYAIRRLRC
eukprot:XP_001705244.1 Hypothetical protein GL50803_10945 [Giardia lamblia ATCC 50803]